MNTAVTELVPPWTTDSPADGYYEWFGHDEQTGRRQPYFIHPQDGGVLAMAGLYELWRDPARAAEDPLRWRWTATVITTAAEDELGRLHDRMPLLVPPDRYREWLDPAPRDPAELRRLLVPAAAGRLAAYRVRTLVNSVANNGPELVEPLPADDWRPAGDGGGSGADGVAADARLW